MSDKLNKIQIQELLPHREPMLLIDELKDINIELSGKKTKAQGTSSLSTTNSYFNSLE